MANDHPHWCDYHGVYHQAKQTCVAGEEPKAKTGCVLCGDKIKQTAMLCEHCVEWSAKGICCK